MNGCRWILFAGIVFGSQFLESFPVASAQEPRPPESANQTRRPNRRPANAQAPPTATGKVAAFETERSITVEVNQRGGQTRKADFNIDKDKTKIELRGDAKELGAGIAVQVWADKDDAKLALRIVAGQNNNPQPRTRRPGNRPNPAPAPRPDSAPAPTNAPTTTIPPRPPRQPVAGLDPAAVARQIDQHIDARLTAEKIQASPRCDDAEFIRRVYLDITGVIPPPDKVVAFLSDTAADKRARLIDELLASPRYGWHFADEWCDRINVKDLPIYREPFIAWMSDSLNANRGWDEIAYDLLTAGGQFSFVTRGRRLSSSEPQALFVLMNTEEGQGKGPNPAWLAAESGRLLLGVQLQCAECHDHPFTDSWKQTDFWGLAALFGQLRSERLQQGGLTWQESPAAASEPVSIVIPPTALKNIGLEVSGRLLGADHEFRPGEAENLRQALARWMTAPENPYFARATANRLWAHFFGRGLVNPVDDLRPDNRASHPEILDLLAAECRQSQFDLQHLIRCLCLSEAYQRTSMPLAENEQDDRHYSHMALRVMSPGALYDSLQAATGWPDIKVGLPERKTKLTVASLFTPREVFVDFFRSSQGEEPSPLENAHGIPQALKLMNAVQLNRVAPSAGRLAASNPSRDETIEQLYLAALARRPTADETKLMSEFFDRQGDRDPEQESSAILWVLINSAEFVSNH
jgi:hypothetical protein